MTYSLINLFYDAHDGDAMANLAKHYGLHVDQAERVVEALLPAFSIGLKHNTANPLSLNGFLDALQTGRHMRFFNDPMTVFAPGRLQEERTILGHLLGSKQVSRAVADQVEATTGVATAIVREMMPAVGAIVMGGLAKEAPRNPFTEPVEAFVEGFARGRPEPEPEPMQHGLLDAFGAFLQGFGRGRVEDLEEEPETENAPPQSGEQMFGGLFETGIEVQRKHLKAINGIFDRFYGQVEAEEDEDD